MHSLQFTLCKSMTNLKNSNDTTAIKNMFFDLFWLQNLRNQKISNCFETIPQSKNFKSSLSMNDPCSDCLFIIIYLTQNFVLLTLQVLLKYLEGVFYLSKFFQCKKNSYSSAEKKLLRKFS